jgi:polyhydroxyalkanoate synthesis regulator phasin
MVACGDRAKEWIMLDLVRKAYLLGLGLASLTREKVEEIVDELVHKGEIAEKDRRQVLDDLLARAREEQKRLRGSVRETVQKVLTETGIPTQKEFEDLLERVSALEKLTKRQETVKEDDVSSSESS